MSPQSLLFSRLNNPNSLSLSSQERCSSPRIIFVSLLWTHSNLVHIFPVLRASELDAGLQVGSHQSTVEGQNQIPRPAGYAAFHAAQDVVGFWAASTHCWFMSSFSSTSTLTSSEVLWNFSEGHLKEITPSREVKILLSAEVWRRRHHRPCGGCKGGITVLTI